MNFIKNLKIRDKLFLLLLILLPPLLFFAYTKITDEAIENRELRAIVVNLEESEKISLFIHQFQKERARILAAMGDGQQFRAEALKLRGATDASVRDLKEFALKHNRPMEELALIGDINKYRNDFDKNKLNEEEFDNYSSNLLNVFIDKIHDNASGITNVDIRRELLSFVHLVSAKTDLGRLRSLLMSTLHHDSLTFQSYSSFRSLWGFYNYSMRNFNRYAGENFKKETYERTNDSNYAKVIEIVETFERNPRQSITQIKPIEIFTHFTNTVENIRVSEGRLIESIRNQVDEESRIKERNLILLIGVTAIALIIAGLISVYIVRLISGAILSLKSSAEKIAAGATEVNIDTASRDEIGSLAISFNKVARKNNYLSKVTQAIGEGKYDIEMEAMNKEDVLGNSILRMKENLGSLSKENDRRNWILSGVSDLNNRIIGVLELEKLSHDALSYVCTYTNSMVGIFYVLDESGYLQPTAIYGASESIGNIVPVKMGSGIVGQTILERQIKLIDGVADKFMKIKTGVSEIDPATIALIPMHFSTNVIGVIEIATRDRYTERHLEFLGFAGERIAIVVHTLQAHLKTQELLYETQNQAEELETQQEELRQLNAELKASEEELRVSQEELQEKNAELEEKAQLLEEQYEAIQVKNKAIDDARQAIELKMHQVETVSKYKSEFLANMSHELRTPLNSILILSRLLSDNKESNLNPKQKEHAQIIHNSGSDLLKLINEILDLAKIESGQVKLEIGENKLRELKVDQLFRGVALDKNIDFEVSYGPDLYDTIVTDKFRLEQILKNFLGNAFKFTEKGGKIKMVIQKAPPDTILTSESLLHSTEIIAFSVEDTGIGIPKDKQQLIFEAFQQADSSTTRKYGGTGLGLAISRELAILLGGEIKVESEVGKGSRFTLYLPRVKNGTPKVKKVTPEIQVDTREEKQEVRSFLNELPREEKKQVSLLIIEDDRGFNNILADFAKGKSFTVIQAFTGKDGFRMANEDVPDAILLDINLPDISGWDVLKMLRENKETKNIKIHVMSAYDKEVVNQAAYNEEYLAKPVTLEMLDKAFTNISTITDKSIDTILVVEDNEVENKAISELLGSHSIKSLSAFSAEQAEDILSKQQIDCIILDLNLPGKKGAVWLEQLRSKKQLSDIPVIIYSGKDLSEDEEKELKRFANTVIIKNEYSYIRLMDEVQLFLHKVNQKFPEGKEFKMKLHVPEEVLKDKKVLIVDDDVRNIYSLYSLLEMHGMNIVTANDGKEALDKLDEENDIDIVLMDVMMPVMDGIEATRRIRRNSKFRNLPVIALTAKAMKGDREKCIEAGASDYIPKPVDTEKLLTLMRVWLYES